MTTIIERIQQFIEYKGISVRAFEISINASNGLIRHALTKNTDIQSKWLSIIADIYPQLSIEWLVTGKGEMLKESITHQKEIQQTLPNQEQEIVLLKEFLKEERLKVDVLNQKIGQLKERLAFIERGKNEE